MKKSIHPHSALLSVVCSCGEQMKVTSSYPKQELKLDVCNRCHPFFTGKQRVVDVGGRVDRFNKRFGALAPKASA